MNSAYYAMTHPGEALYDQEKSFGLVGIVVAVVFMSLLLVGVWEEDDQQNEFEHYCQMVEEGSWPDFKGVGKECEDAGYTLPYNPSPSQYMMDRHCVVYPKGHPEYIEECAGRDVTKFSIIEEWEY